MADVLLMNEYCTFEASPEFPKLFRVFVLSFYNLSYFFLVNLQSPRPPFHLAIYCYFQCVSPTRAFWQSVITHRN